MRNRYPSAPLVCVVQFGLQWNVTWGSFSHLSDLEAQNFRYGAHARPELHAPVVFAAMYRPLTLIGQAAWWQRQEGLQ